MTGSPNIQTSVVVLGAGYAGLLFTVRLARKTAERTVRITLVNESDTFTERLRLHQFATNQTIPWRPIRDMLRGTGVEFVHAEVAAIRPERHEVALRRPAAFPPDTGQDTGQDTATLRYDYLVYALGSLTERTSVPGVDRYAYTLAPRGALSAAALREMLPSLSARPNGRVVVCGAGATGIETAAELAQTYPALEVRLVTQGEFGLFVGAGVAAYMRRSLERLGVTITDQVTLTEVQSDRVLTSHGEVMRCDACIWTGGFVAPGIAREAGLPVNERGQVLVDPYMRSLSDGAIYAIGDAASPAENPSVAVRMSAATATILAAHGADCLSAMLRGEHSHPLSFAYAGQGIALGRGNAIGFNAYPDDHPHHPYFTGRLGYSVREWFVDFLAAAPVRERHMLGSFFWFGKGRYARQQRRERSTEQQLRPLARPEVTEPVAGRATIPSNHMSE